MRTHQALLIFVILYLLLSLLYQRATPPLEASDEAAHMAMVLHLHHLRSLPNVTQLSEVRLVSQQLTQAPLYYALAAAWIYNHDTSDSEYVFIRQPRSTIGRADLPGPKRMWMPDPERSSNDSGVLAAVSKIRLLSMLFGLGALLLLWRTTRRHWKSEVTPAFFATTLVAFNPMFLFITNSVNNDALLILLATASLCYLLHLEDKPISYVRIFICGMLISCTILTKTSGLVLLPVALIALLTSKNAGLKYKIRGAVLLLGSCALVCGWWFVRNKKLYGEWLAFEAHIALIGNRRSVVDPWALLREWDGFVKSYWGVFGGFNVIFSDAVYAGLFALTTILVLTVVIAVVSKRFVLRRMPLLCLLFSLANLLAVGYWTSQLLGSQGRLLFPSIAAHALLATWGIKHLASNKLRVSLLLLVPLCLLALALWGAIVVIPNAYYA